MQRLGGAAAAQKLASQLPHQWPPDSQKAE